MMWIAYHSCVDSASLAVAELPALAQALFEDLEQYIIRAEPSWRPDVRNVSAPRAGIVAAYVDHYDIACPIALFQVCPPEEGPDEPEGVWWLRAVPYPIREGDSAYRMLIASAAGWLRERPHVIHPSPINTKESTHDIR